MHHISGGTLACQLTKPGTTGMQSLLEASNGFATLTDQVKKPDCMAKGGSLQYHK